MVSKESRALSVNELVDCGTLTTVLSKLALPHFDDFVLLFLIGSGLLRALVLGSSGVVTQKHPWNWKTVAFSYSLEAGTKPSTGYFPTLTSLPVFSLCWISTP